MKNKPIRTTYPLLPPLDEYVSYLEKIWESGIITNRGTMEVQFGMELKKKLGLEHLSVVNNGTTALILALKSLKLSGEVITTPFTHISTSQAILWNGLTPVFVDIEEDTYNIDPEKIEQAITPQTSAILAVHLFGQPCHIAALEKIAKKHRIKLIFDAAHCFGVKENEKSILQAGDCSTISFHATKTFNTIEGGAIICKDPALYLEIEKMKNNGIDGTKNPVSYGLNGKMNEFQAAFGLLQLQYVDQAIQKRKEIIQLYQKKLQSIKGITMMNEKPGIKYNYGYFPIMINPTLYGYTRDQLFKKLETENIHCKKYFDPLVSDVPIFKHFKRFPLPVAEKVAQNIICLPLHHLLEEVDVARLFRMLDCS
jgi:dTDP-4-amino-4,6-dideoxygalactose transaminase